MTAPTLQTEDLPADPNLVNAALAYLAQIGRTPAAEQRWTAGDRRYLAGPLIVGDPAWGDDTPAWLRVAVRIARLGLVLAGEHEHASEEEAVACLMAASLAAPLHPDWAAIYLWLAARVLARWGMVGQDEDFSDLAAGTGWRVNDAVSPQHTLQPDQEDDLRRLLRDIRRSVERHARLPHTVDTDAGTQRRGDAIRELTTCHLPLATYNLQLATHGGNMNTTLWLCEMTGDPVPFHDCLACAERRQVPACPFPPTLLRALANSMRGDDGLLEAQALAQRAGVALLRVTGLLGCTRQAWYTLHGRPPLERPGGHWSRLRGAIFHAALESLAGEHALAETRLIVSLEELGARAWIAGRVDHYDPALRLLTDYKSVNSFGRKMASLDLPKPQHVAQLWIYGWLLARSGYPYPQAARVVYMDMGAVRTVDVPMPDADMQAAVEARLVEKARLITGSDPDGPAGDPQEPWQCHYCAHADQCPYRLVG